MVTKCGICSTLSSLVTCVGCRRSVESLYQTLAHTGDTALEPLTIDTDGVVSVNRDHIEVETSLANLFCSQVSRLSRELTEGGEGKVRAGKRGGRGGRCSLHSLEVRKRVTISNWQETWDCMEQECREEVVLLPYNLLRQTLDGYLKKHSFCTECTSMVNKAYSLLVEEGQVSRETTRVITTVFSSLVFQEPAKAAGEKTVDCDPNVNSDGSANLYCGISACTADLHVHVRCDENFIGQLFRLAEPELSGLRQERHAKTIEIAQKEVLTCIGLALFDRFQRIQQKLREAEQTCDLLYLTLLKTLRMSLDLAAEKKRGIGDLEMFCEELEKDEKKKEVKKEGKKERKRNRRVRQKESKCAALAKINSAEESKVVSDGESNSGDSGVSIPTDTLRDETNDGDVRDDTENKEDKEEDEKENINTRNINHFLPPTTSQVLTTKITFQPRETFSLMAMLEEDEDLSEDLIPQEEIRNFLDNSEDMTARRQQLRENLKARFDQMCVTGALNERK